MAPALCRVTDNGGSHTCTTTADSHVLWTMNTLDAELHLTSQSAGMAFSTAQTFSADTGALLTVRAGPSDVLAQFTYVYDALGNLTYSHDDLNSVFERYCYDGLNRLTTSATKASDPATCTATGAGITAKTIAYDQVGNITSKNDVGTYSYPSSGSARPHAISSITGTVNGVTNPSYTYDANGNMLTGAGRTITYTAFNMAASIIQGTIADCLAYDSNHARIKMEVRVSACGGTLSATTYYLNDLISGAMSEKLVAGGTTTWHDYVIAGGGIVAERSCTGATPCSSGATWSFFVLDHLGSTAVLTNAAGTATEQLSYDAWGRRRNLNGTDNSACSITSATSRGYTGHEMLDSICEINANARIYDPTIARFMSADSIVPNASNGQSFNRYSYVENGPLSAIDPSGHTKGDGIETVVVYPTDPVPVHDNYRPTIYIIAYIGYPDVRTDNGDGSSSGGSGDTSAASDSGPPCSAAGLGNIETVIVCARKMKMFGSTPIDFFGTRYPNEQYARVNPDGSIVSVPALSQQRFQCEDGTQHAENQIDLSLFKGAVAAAHTHPYWEGFGVPDPGPGDGIIPGELGIPLFGVTPISVWVIRKGANGFTVDLLWGRFSNPSNVRRTIQGYNQGNGRDNAHGTCRPISG